MNTLFFDLEFTQEWLKVNNLLNIECYIIQYINKYKI